MKYYICSSTCPWKKDSTISRTLSLYSKSTTTSDRGAVTWLHTKLSETVVVVNSMHITWNSWKQYMWVGYINLTELLSTKNIANLVVLLGDDSTSCQQ